MQRRYSLAHFILLGVVVLGLTSLMVRIDAQAQITFVSKRAGNAEIYVMDADGENLQRLTNNRNNDWDPSWSPDGEQIVFFSNRDGHFRDDIPDTSTYEIYVMDADGGNPQNLTNNPHGDVNPAWLNSPFSISPIGKKFTIWGWLKQVSR